jgi:hypothetical protein
MVALFHPRNEKWADHFEADGPFIVGKTPTGRVSVYVLNMTERLRVELRNALKGTPPS